MDLISQRDQAKLILQDAKYAASKKCTVCGLPTGNSSLKCIQCLQKAYLAEELAYTRQWLLGHLGALLVVGHDTHGILHVALLRKSMLNTGWCGGHISQKRETRKQVKLGEFPAKLYETTGTPVKVCGLCLGVWDQMGLRS
jgi:hypothetical protein